MADFKFSCPHCGIGIECDELWCGHQIQCPSCQKELDVPPKPASPPHARFASAAPGQSRLSIGQSRAERSATSRPVAPQAALLEQQLAAAKAGRKSVAPKWIAIGAGVVVLGVAGYFAYEPVTKWWAKRAEAAKQASAPPPVTNAAPAEPPPPPPPKELPVLPAVWTLDVERAKIPEGKANGTISGTNFIVETATWTPPVLRLYQGVAASPDRELQIFLRLNPGESVTGRTWTVAQDLRGKSVPQVVKRWKTNPRYAPQSKPFSYGYAMKLELGEMETNLITGKIFLALPDPEQSVVAGVFKAVTVLAPATAAGAPTPVAAPSAQPSPPERATSDRRYGRKAPGAPR